VLQLLEERFRKLKVGGRKRHVVLGADTLAVGGQQGSACSFR